MKPESVIRERIDEVGRAIAQGLGARALCVAVYGSAAGEEFAPRHSDVNLLVVLREIDFADLRLIGATLERHAGPDLEFATPLVITPDFLAHAGDAFPIEIEDIRGRHRIVAGDDLVAGLRVPPGALRVAAEREARTALLRLRSLALHRPPDGDLRRGIAHAGATFAILGRALLPFEAAAPPRGAALLAEFARRGGLRFEAFVRVLEMREGTRPWPEDRELERLLEQLHVELEALVAKIDAGGL